jgi:hypothetical protein
MDTSHARKVALATVVTQRALSEFLMLKRSLELFHGPDHQWFVRCDEATRASLAACPNVHCIVSADQCTAPDEPLFKQGWRALMSEKMNAIDDAWNAGTWDAVLYLDSDIVVLAPFLDSALARGGQVVLTPHFRQGPGAEQISMADYYNGGFVLMREKRFTQWWRAAAAAERSHMADQTCLGRAREAFDVRDMGDTANVGWWRGRSMWDTPRLPAGCLFCHVHLFQEPHLDFELSQKVFALNCVEFLTSSSVREHQLIAQDVFALDTSGYYDTLLRRRVVVLTACEPRRAVRLLLMAHTLPKQTEVRCVCHGSREELLRRINRAPLPSHLQVIEANGPSDRRAWLAPGERRADFVFLVDIDFVFPLAFWYTLCAATRAGVTEESVTCPVPLQDPDGRFLWYQFWHQHHGVPALAVPLREDDQPSLRSAVRADIFDWETPRTHYLPYSAAQMACAAPVFASAPRTFQEVSTRAAACVELEHPSSETDGRAWPGALMATTDFLEHRPPKRWRVATSSFIFHLWHPADQESPCAGWHSRDEHRSAGILDF